MKKNGLSKAALRRPGPRALGPKYPKLLTVSVTELMRDYVALKGAQEGLSGAEWVRKKLFPEGWETEVGALRR